MHLLSKAPTSAVPIAWIAAIACVANVPGARANTDLLDVVARIDFGYYAGDVRLIEAASAELERVSAPDPARAYYRAYAAFRLNQIDSHASGRSRRERAHRCIDETRELTESHEWAIEAHVLRAACSLWARDALAGHALGFDIRLTQSLDAARNIDSSNPRLLLVAALAREDELMKGTSRTAALEQALARFDEQGMSLGLQPGWGRAEALAHTGAIYLERGDLRGARDLIERALLEAPEYQLALRLQNALSSR